MATDSKKKKQYLATGLVVLVAVIAVLLKYSAYVANPWTRDGHVRARVVQIAPRVSGPIVELPIVDNQRVKAGDVLFQIDPRTYEASLAQARAEQRRRWAEAGWASEKEAAEAGEPVLLNGTGYNYRALPAAPR